MKKTAKKAAKRPLVRKVEAAHRTREGKQKKARLKPHVEEDARPPDFGPIPPEVYDPYTPPEAVGEGRPLTDAYNECLRDRQEQGESITRLMQGAGCSPFRDDNSIVPRAYRERYGAAGNCGDMIAIILANRPQRDIEEFVYQKTGKAWPGLNKGQRRMNAGNVIRAMVRGLDQETMAWLLATSPV